MLAEKSNFLKVDKFLLYFPLIISLIFMQSNKRANFFFFKYYGKIVKEAHNSTGMEMYSGW